MNKIIFKSFIFIFLFFETISSYKLDQLSLDEKIGQLIMVAIPTDCDEENFKLVKDVFEKYKPGAAIFLGLGTLKKQNQLINELQGKQKIKLIIAKDLEPGFFRFTDLIEFPKNRVLGQVDDNIVFEVAKTIGIICNLTGITMNLAPVVDVSCNPQNPVIKMRAFGPDKFVVASKGIAFSKGLQIQNVISCAKHFPGHGDTEVDSHVDLPIIKHSKSRLEDIELYPFREMINNGVDSVMVAHLKVLALDQEYPASLSKKIINFLKNDLNFNGLIITDALNMKGITNNYSQTQAAVKALEAGNDIVLIVGDYKDLYSEILLEIFNAIKHALEENLLNINEIDNKVEKILKYKNKILENYYCNNLKDEDIKQLNSTISDLNYKIYT